MSDVQKFNYDALVADRGQEWVDGVRQMARAYSESNSDKEVVKEEK